jgi:acyl-coenzyme A thioesterase PaaI-like protein
VTPNEATDRLRGIPFIRALGLRAVKVGPETSRCLLPAAPALAARGGGETICPGVIAAAVDQAGSMAVWSAFGLALPHATICLGLSFFTPARLGDLVFETRLLAANDTLGQTEVLVLQDGRPVARGRVDFALGSYPGAAGPSVTQPLDDPARIDGAAIAPLGGDDFAAALGLQPGNGGLHLPFAANLVGSRDPVALHGGVLAAASIASAEVAVGPEGELRLIDFSIDYLRSGLPRMSQLRPKVVSRTRRTALVEIAVQQDADRLVTRARARFYEG